VNVYLVETPHQLLNAVEARHTLGLEDNLLLVLTLEEYPREAYEPLIAGDEWREVRFLPTRIENRGAVARYLGDHPSERVRGYFNTYEYLQLRRLLDWQASTLTGVENLFLGNYVRIYMRHFANMVRPRRLCLLDDGTVTLTIHALREQMHTGCGTYSLDAPLFRKRLVTRLLGYRGRQAESLTYFTTYDLAMSNSDRIIRNEYRYFRQKAMSAAHSDEVFFLGMTMISEGCTDELYLECLEKVVRYFAGEKFVYVPHKCEPPERVERLRKALGLTIRRFDVPIEYQLCISGPLPKVLASFFSSALENCRVIFEPHLDIKSFRIDPKLFPLKPDFVRRVYNYYQSKSGRHFEVVRL
jgi:hypothetical protein